MITSVLIDAVASLGLGIEILVKTPIQRFDMSAANSFGNVLADYTNALLGLSAGRPTVNVADATYWTGQSDLSNDKLHPSDQGHA